MHIRALALLALLFPAAVAAQERLVLVAAAAAVPAPPPQPRVVPGGTVRVVGAPQTLPGLWLDF